MASAAAGMNKMRREMLFYRRAYKDSSRNALWQYMLESFAERYTRLAKEKPGVEQLDTQTKYSIRLYCYGCVGMTREWSLRDSISPRRGDRADDVCLHAGEPKADLRIIKQQGAVSKYSPLFMLERQAKIALK